jgi:hypothetical protein
MLRDGGRGGLVHMLDLALEILVGEIVEILGTNLPVLIANNTLDLFDRDRVVACACGDS